MSVRHVVGTRRPPALRRPGFTIPEMIIAMVILAIIGVAGLRLFVTQSRFYDLQSKQHSSRSVARSSVNLFLSELRMVEATNGVVAASPTSVTLRVPYAFGLFCGGNAGTSTVSLLPVDSATLAAAGLSGYAWRASSGAYTYTTSGVSVGPGTAAVCDATQISTLGNGRIVDLAPPLPAAAVPGQAVFLYQHVRYDFAPSTAIPGRRAIWRLPPGGGPGEELAAPFDTSARFRFFALTNDTSDVTVPPVADIRGLELVFDATSERPRFGRTAPERTPYRTAVYFTNRIN